METQLSADALDKLKCRFVEIIRGEIQNVEYGFNCIDITQEEINRIKNYIYLLETDCLNVDTCEIDLYVSKLPDVNVCITTPITITCGFTLSRPTPDTCIIYNLIRL